MDSELGELFRRGRPHARDVERFEHRNRLADLGAEEEVAPGFHEIDDGEILIDRGDAGIQGVTGGVELDLLAVDLHHTGVGSVETGHDLDQRRLAGAVVTEHAGDLPRPNREIDADRARGCACTTW